jgi:endoglucanase
MPPVLRILVLCTLALAVIAAPAGAAPRDVIRAGGPSAPANWKIAVVASKRNLAGRTFTVQRSGTAVFSGQLVRAPGSARPWRHAALANFSSVTAPGSYVVRVGRLRSRPWVVDAGAARRPIQAMLRYFAANSDGREPSPIHGPSHLNDATVASGPYRGRKFDLTGGWMDAGDMIKFTQTTGFSALLLQYAARLSPADAGALNSAADVGIRWLLKAHPAPGLFILHVGDERDHDVGFRNPARDDRSRKPGIGKRLAYPGIGGDTAGKVAAALALAADRTPALREPLLGQAREWYAAGKAAGRPAPRGKGGFYPSSTWKDDMAAGAAALHRSTGEPGYLADAAAYLAERRPGEPPSTDWFPHAAADLCGGYGAPPVEDLGVRALACGVLRDLGVEAGRYARRAAFGFASPLYWGATGSSGAYGALAAAAERAAGLEGGLAVAAGARDYLLGRNPWGASFLVSYGPNPARHPHHWASRPGQPVGAVVGGPAPLKDIREQKLKVHRRSPYNTRSAFYEDHRDNYVNSEPAIDYTAASILLVAALQG